MDKAIEHAFDEITVEIFRTLPKPPKDGKWENRQKGQKFCKGICNASIEGKPSKNPYDLHYFCRCCGIGDGVWGLKTDLVKGRCPCCNRNVSIRPKKSKINKAY